MFLLTLGQGDRYFFSYFMMIITAIDNKCHAGVMQVSISYHIFKKKCYFDNFRFEPNVEPQNLSVSFYKPSEQMV